MGDRPRARLIGALALALCCASCGAVPQPESLRTTAAYEIPLYSAQSKRAFIGMLRVKASAFGYHVDVASDDALRIMSEASPITMNVAVWRGENDDENIASAMDFQDHLGRVWLDFAKGEDPATVIRFRQAVMAEVQRRWPDTRSLPVLPGGNIPGTDDMVRTPDGYQLKESARAKYAK